MKNASTHPHSRAPDRTHVAVRLVEATPNRKLAPVRLEPYSSATYSGKGRPVPAGPFCAATYTSIESTCRPECRFKAGACYVRAGFTGRMSAQLDAIAAERGLSPLRIAEQEAMLMDRAFNGGGIPQDGARGGRDLRLHVGGDAFDERSVRVLALAAARWRGRGGGAVWTFTHSAFHVKRAAWGRRISVLASVETLEDANRAAVRGYVPALTVQRHEGERAWEAGGWRFVPCPAETHDNVTCISCRLCLDDGALRKRRTGISFALHGPSAGRVTLPVVR